MGASDFTILASGRQVMLFKPKRGEITEELEKIK
jgi:hypothetical protein